MKGHTFALRANVHVARMGCPTTCHIHGGYCLCLPGCACLQGLQELSLSHLPAMPKCDMPLLPSSITQLHFNDNAHSEGFNHHKWKAKFPRSCRSWPGCYISRCRQLRFRQLSCVASLALEAALGSLHAAAHRLRRGRRIRGHRRVRTGRQQRNCSAARCAAAADMPPAATAEFGPS